MVPITANQFTFVTVLYLTACDSPLSVSSCEFISSTPNMLVIALSSETSDSITTSSEETKLAEALSEDANTFLLTLFDDVFEVALLEDVLDVVPEVVAVGAVTYSFTYK